MRFEVSLCREILVKTKSGYTTDSLLRVLQLLRDRSPDDEIRRGASLMIVVLSKSINEIQSSDITRVSVSFKWLYELSQNARKKPCFWFISAFVNEILVVNPNQRSLTQ